MPTDSTITVSIIDPIEEDVDEVERSIESALVHIAGPETITGLKTFTQYVPAPEFRGTLRGDIIEGRLLGPLNLNGFPLLGLSGVGLEELANKGVANGYAPLGPTALVPAANLGTGGSGTGTNFLADDGQFRPISAGSVSFGTQAANLVFAGPSSGAAAAPAFRLMAVADIPTLPQSKITNLESDLLSKVPTSRTITEGAGLAGNTYDLSANRTLALGVPSTLLVSSVNSASGTTHSHAITSSSNPGVAAALLASDGSGRLTLTRLTLTDYLIINALTANLYLKDTSTGLQVATTGIITPQATNIFRNTSYTSGVRGWNIDDDGNAEFNNIRARGEIAGAVFKISEIAATAGTHGVFFSASTVEADFTTPASTGTSFTFNAKNSDAGGMLFGVNDVVRFKTWTGAGISDAWATITARVNHTTYTSYTATLNSGSTSATFRAGTAVVDYGPSGTGFITLSADGTVGSSPNMTMATHAGSPWTAQTTLLRAGNLNGSYGYASNVYGVGIGQYGVAQSWLTFDTTNGIRIGNNTTVRIHLAADGSGFLANSNISWDTSGNLNVVGSAVIAGFSIGSDYLRDNANSMGITSTVSGSDDVRFWAGETFANRVTAPFRIYESGAVVATSATISGNITSTSGAIGGWTLGTTSLTSGTGANTVGLDSGGTNPAFYAGSATPGSAPFRVTPAGALTATNATISGNVTATGGTIGGFTIGSDYIRDNTDSFGMASTVTGSDDVRFWAGSTFVNRGSAPLRVTESGVLFGSNVNLTGAINATSGTFGVVAANQANMHWNPATQRLEFRGSTNGTVVQSYIDTDGSLKIADGQITLNSDGIRSTIGSILEFRDGTDRTGYLQQLSQGQVHIGAFTPSASGTSWNKLSATTGGGGQTVQFEIWSHGPSSGFSVNTTSARLYGGNFLGLVIGSSDTAADHMLDVYGTGWFESASNSSVPGFSTNITGTGTSLGQALFQASLANGNVLYNVIGKAWTTNSAAYTAFTPNATGSLNRLSFGFFGSDHLLNVFQSGGVSIGAAASDPGTSRLGLTNTTAPSTPTGFGILYVESGALKFKGTAGTVTTVAPA